MSSGLFFRFDSEEFFGCLAVYASKLRKFHAKKNKEQRRKGIFFAISLAALRERFIDMLNLGYSRRILCERPGGEIAAFIVTGLFIEEDIAGK